ncbi:DinB family protein [Hanstruepera marina]|uniref:DinB family protein n=1 Tax=Hanstruepera marina TaxID=2873265 RepID=UPI001CA60A01|nr:DinB family protein [Hanstruepera marina]
MAFNLEKSIEVLERTPKALHVLLIGLSDDWIYSNEGDNTWSPFDVVGHLIHGEKTDWIPRITNVLNKSENKMFEPFDRFAQFEASKNKSIHTLLGEFETLRYQNLAYLKTLNISKEQLYLKGQHPELGEVTLEQLIATWVTHDLGHIAQISRVMAKQYKNNVGPWIQYISILND